jgi:hypothetical protein
VNNLLISDEKDNKEKELQDNDYVPTQTLDPDNYIQDDHSLKAAIEDNLEYPCCSKKKNKWEAKVFLYTRPKVITHSFAAKVIIVCCRCV